MKIKGLTITVLTLVFVVSLGLSPVLLAQEAQAEQEQAKIYIPDAVKAVMMEGAQTQEPRLDIPFSFVTNYFMPAQQAMHTVFFFKVKNSDLGFAPLVADTPAVKEGEEKEEQEVSSFEETPARLQCRANVFLRITQVNGNINKEIFVPLNIQVDGKDYNPDKEVIYSVGYPLPAGSYLLTMAITSMDLQKIGMQFHNFTLPDMAAATDLDTTSIFFVKKVDRMATPEMTAEIHPDFFTYSVLQMTPNLDNSFAAGEMLDIFYFIMGSQPNATQQYDIDVNYEVFDAEDKIAIRYPAAKYNAPIVSQPLPLKQTVIIRSTDDKGEQTEKTEERDLSAGKYYLVMNIKDNISGKTLMKKVEFTMKEAIQ
ncbi:hypothetical protein ACFLT9_13210 [Acidobacteriota bacterium]